MKVLILVVMAALLAAACTPAATPTDEPADPPPDTAVTSPASSEPPALPSYAPRPGDSNFERNPIFIGEAGIILRESFPVQVALVLSGELPTPCHQFRAIVNPPDDENKIQVEAYTLVNPQLNCIQVLKPFQEMVELGTFPGGHYTVWVNEMFVGEFDT